MELFYSKDIEGGICRLDHDESGHCIKVLRHRCGDEISVIDGCGTLYKCRIVSDSHKEVTAAVIEEVKDWGSHPYRLHMAATWIRANDFVITALIPKWSGTSAACSREEPCP